MQSAKRGAKSPPRFISVVCAVRDESGPQDIKIVQKRGSRMRACIPRFLFSRDAHMRLRYNSNYTGEFLRGFSCTAFASIRGYKPAVPFFFFFFPLSSNPQKYAERVISNKLAVLYAKRLVNVRIACMIISFETRKTSLSTCIFLII